MDVSVVIPARDAAGTLPTLLRALAAQETGAAWEAILVDDGSSDATPALAEAAGLRIIRGPQAGPAAARNRGAAVATGALLAFTDADCAPDPGWLAALLVAARDADLVQGRVLPPPDAPVGPFDRHISVVTEYGLYETANLAIARDLFERLGGFESILTPGRGGKELGEDVWLGWRARRAGARTTFAAGALVHHAVFPRGPRGYVAERARLRFFPELARRVPELRDGFLHRRVFLNRRSMLFDAAVGGALAAAATRRPWPLLAALPYAGLAGQDPPLVAATRVAADAVGLAAMAAGSVRSRSLVI
jgi:glycosyltransferase involved in cell wall biosynthesis